MKVKTNRRQRTSRKEHVVKVELRCARDGMGYEILVTHSWDHFDVDVYKYLTEEQALECFKLFVNKVKVDEIWKWGSLVDD
jgi:hypothetical protein